MASLNWIVAALALGLTACAHTGGWNAHAPLAGSPQTSCASDKASISKDFATGAFGQCKVDQQGNFTLSILPEFEFVNPSPWYAFRVDPKQTGAISVTLRYPTARHRYAPKMSTDGSHWSLLPETETRLRDPKHFVMHLPVMANKPLLIAAQPLFPAARHEAWIRKMAKEHDLALAQIGQSMSGHKLFSLTHKAGPDKPWVVIVGRQHPPETTGANALMPFVQTLLADDDLANKFRAHFNLLLIPLINPDGVDEGHWRLNNGETDLNRDWGPFKQPETQAARHAIENAVGARKLALFLDFHSTWKNLLYTQLDAEPTNPPMFARDWLKAVHEKLPEGVYPFTREARRSTQGATSKTWMYTQYGAPSMTFEVGDETPISDINQAAPVFARQAMKLLLVEK